MTTVNTSAYSVETNDSFELAQTPSNNTISVAGFAPDQSSRVLSRVALSALTNYYCSARLNASGTFQIIVNTYQGGDTVTIFSPSGEGILSISSGLQSSAQFTIPRNTANSINNGVVTFQYTTSVARTSAIVLFDYTFAQIPQITDYVETQTFTPGVGESFAYTSSGFTCIITRPTTIGTAIPLITYTNSPAPTTWTLTSSNTAIFANSSGTSGTAVVGSPGAVSVTPLVTSSTAIAPVTITLVITSLGTQQVINPVPYQ